MFHIGSLGECQFYGYFLVEQGNFRENGETLFHKSVGAFHIPDFKFVKHKLFIMVLFMAWIE